MDIYATILVCLVNNIICVGIWYVYTNECEKRDRFAHAQLRPLYVKNQNFQRETKYTDTNIHNRYNTHHEDMLTVYEQNAEHAKNKHVKDKHTWNTQEKTYAQKVDLKNIEDADIHSARMLNDDSYVCDVNGEFSVSQTSSPCIFDNDTIFSTGDEINVDEMGTTQMIQPTNDERIKLLKDSNNDLRRRIQELTTKLNELI